MSTYANYNNSFTSEELPFAEALIDFISNSTNKKYYLSQLILMPDKELRDILLDQENTDDHITQLAEFIYDSANAISTGTEESKWSQFKNLWPDNLQHLAQIIIDNELLDEDPATLFNDFKVRSASTHATNLLQLTIAPYDFWNAYISYFKNKKAYQLIDKWILVENRLQEGDLKDFVLSMHLQAQSSPDWEETYPRKYNDLNSLESIATTLASSNYNLKVLSYLSKLIKINADLVINGFLPKTKKETAFLELFREELREGISTVLDDWTDVEFIPDTDTRILSLLDKSGETYFSNTITQTAGASQPHVIKIKPLKASNNPYSKIEIGDQFVLKLKVSSTVYLTYTVASDDPVVMRDGLITAINNATSGNWANVTASVNGTDSTYIDVTYNTNNVVFTLTPRSIYSQLLSLESNHPLYFGLANLTYNDALNIESPEVIRNFKGRLIQNGRTALTPVGNQKVKIFDMEDEENPVEIITTTTDAEGYFSCNYTLLNSHVESKNLRISILDSNDEPIPFMLESENLFTEISNGTFENGTAPNYTEWDVTLGEDIKIAPSERLGDELVLNGDFSSKEGWYENTNQGNPVDDGRIASGGYAIGGYQLWTGNILTIGKKYRVSYYFNEGGSGTLNIYSDATTTVATADSTGVHQFDFIAIEEYIGFQGTNGTQIDDFSIRELIPDNTLEGLFSPKFYLDASVATDDFIFKTDNPITLQEDTHYEVSAYLYFNDPLVAEEVLYNSGLYLAPVGFDLSDLEIEVINEDRILRYENNIILDSTPSGKGTWKKIKTRFVYDGDPVSIGIFLKGDLEDYKAGFSFSIDSLKIIAVTYENLDVTVQVGSYQTTVFSIYETGLTAVKTVVSQSASISDPHKYHVILENPEPGDLFLLTLNNQSTVSFEVPETGDPFEALRDGLRYAIASETGDITITEHQAPSSSQPQVSYVTPEDWTFTNDSLIKIYKTPKNILYDADKGNFESTSDTSGNPPSDWGLTKGAFVTNLVRSSTSFHRGAYSLNFTISSNLTKGNNVIFTTENSIQLKKNTRYKIKAQVTHSSLSALIENFAKMYLLPTGFALNEMDKVVSREIRSDISGYREISTEFNSGEAIETTISLVLELEKDINSTGGNWYLDELRFEEIPNTLPIIECRYQGGSFQSLVEGLKAAIVEDSALIGIGEDDPASPTERQSSFVVFPDVRVGAKYALTINGVDPVSFIATTTSANDVAQGLLDSINATTNSLWKTLDASVDSGTGQLILSAQKTNTPFYIEQVGGYWSDITATEDDTKLILTATDNDMPFTIYQSGASWKSVLPTGSDAGLEIEAFESNVTFTLTGKVIKAAGKSISISEILYNEKIELSPAVSEAFAAKEVYTLNDILSLGGLTNNLDGSLKIEITQVATASLPQITRLTPTAVEKGDVFIIYINNYMPITFVAPDNFLSNTVSGLNTAINAATGDWANVTATTDGDLSYIIVTYNSNNVTFSITQAKAAESPEIQKLDSMASLNTLVSDLNLDKETSTQVIKVLQDAGYSSPLAIAKSSAVDFHKIVKDPIGDVNAARMYELASVRRQLTQQLTKNYLANKSSYTVNQSVNFPEDKLTSVLGEQCYCEDCDSAVSPLAYLTDLTNYVLEHLSSEQGKFTLEKLSDTFYQNFLELPASCDDVSDRVCQPRIAIEILRNYLAVNKPVDGQKENLIQETRSYLFSAYKFLLESIGTSYSEVRLAKTEEDKRKLADKLGIDFDTNSTFLTKLFISPPEQLVAMEDWDDFKTVIPGTIQLLIDALNTSLAALDPEITFNDFVELSPADLKDAILSFELPNDFLTSVFKYIKAEATNVYKLVNASSVPKELREEQQWTKLIHNLSRNIFTPEFRPAFEIFEIEWRKTYPNDSFAKLVKASQNILLDLDGTNNRSDFWLPFAEALKAKVEDFEFTEKDLEHLFGLQDTKRNIFSDGAKFNDESNILERWTIRGVEWGQNTDAEGYLYLEMDEVNSSINIFNNSEKNNPADLVAVATYDSERGIFPIAEYNDSGLSGELIATELDSTSQIYISVIPLYLSWKFQGLREQWKDADASREIPIIDPDLVSPGDIEYPYDINILTPTTAIDFWQKRKIDLEAKLVALKELREAEVETTYTIYGTSGSGSTQLNDLQGITVDEDGAVFVADTTNNKVKKLVSATISALSSTVTSPKAILLAPDDTLYVLEADKVKQFEKDGTAGWYFGEDGTSLGMFSSAYDLALNSLGELYVTDANRIQRFTLPKNYGSYFQAAGLQIETTTTAASGVKQVTRVIPLKVRTGDTFALTLAGTGTVTYVATANTVSNVIAGLIKAIGVLWTTVDIVDKETYLEFTHTATNTAFTLSYENGVVLDRLEYVCADKSGNFFVADKSNNRILKLNNEGKIVKVIGQPHRFTEDLVLMYRFDEGIYELPDLIITTVTPHGVGVAEVKRITPVNVLPGTNFRVEINGNWAEFAAYDSVASALLVNLFDSIDAISSTAAVTVDISESNNYIQITANATNTAIAINKSIENYVRDSSDSIEKMVLGIPFHNGNLSGDASWSSLGKTGGSLNFNGTNNYIQTASHTEIDNENRETRTLEIWFNAEEKDNTTAQVLYKQGDDINGMSLYLKGGILYVGKYGSGDTDLFLSAKNIRNNMWHHAVVVVDTITDTFRLYLDGVLADSIDSDGPLKASSNGINLGALANGKIKFHSSTVSSNTTGYYFKGGMDQFRLWNRVLDDQEIINLYQRIEDNSLFIPGAMALDKSGNLYVLDKGTSSILKYDTEGNYLQRLGSFGSGDLKFWFPSGITIDSEGCIIVVDKLNHNIQKINPQGGLLFKVGSAGSSSSNFWYPSSVAVDSNDYLYVADLGNNRIQILEPTTGAFSNSWTTYSQGGTQNITAPVSIAADESDRMIVVFNKKVVRISKDNVTDSYLLPGIDSPWESEWVPTWNNSVAFSASAGLDGYVYMVDSESNVKRFRFPEEYTSVQLQKGITIAQPEFSSILAIDADANNNLHIADAGYHRILKLTKDGYYISSIGKAGESSGTGEGEFNNPCGIAVDESGNSYVCDTNNNRIQKFASDGIFLRMFANNTFFGSSTLNAPKGICVDRNRKVFVANSGADNIIYFDSLHGIGALSEEVMGVKLAILLEIAQSEKQGIDIASQLDALHINFRAYRQLLKLIEFAESGSELLEEHLEDICNISLQCYKQNQYEIWRNEEIANGITLSQDFFRLRGFAQEQSLEFPEWRSDRRQRRDWVSTLQLRIDQEKTTWEEHRRILENAEDELLLKFRDILLMATNFSGSTLAEKAQDGSDKLLIDLKHNCCMRTTRISQAFETLQGVMFSIRNGLLQDTYPDWFIDSVKFDEEWKWMGSYATWRAAQFVFLYPENLLLPSYRSEQTSGFRNLVQEVRNTIQLTPELAYEYLNEYYEYFNDVKNIVVSGSTPAWTVDVNASRDSATPVYRNMLHVIGLSSRSSRIFCSRINTDSGLGELKSSWEHLSAYSDVKVTSLLGVQNFLNTKDEKRYVIVFAWIKDEKGETKFTLLKYDLDTGKWDDSYQEIDIPEFEDNSGTVLPVKGLFLNKETNMWAGTSIFIAVHRGRKVIVYRLDESYSSLEEVTLNKAFWLWNIRNIIIDIVHDFVMQQILYEVTSLSYREAAMIERGHGAPPVEGTILRTVPFSYLFLSAVPKWLVEGNFTYQEASTNASFRTTAYNRHEAIVLPNTSNGDWTQFDVAIIHYPVTEGQFVSSSLVLNALSVVDYVMKPLTIKDVKYFSLFKNAGAANDTLTAIYQDKNGIYLQECKCDNSSTIADLRRLVIQTASVKLHLELSDNLTKVHRKSRDLNVLRTLSKSGYNLNHYKSPFIYQYVEEAFYFVPMLLASQLKKAGYYKEALDFFRTVYDYASDGLARKNVYFGLNKDRSQDLILFDFDSATDTDLIKGRELNPKLLTNAINPKPYGLNTNYLCARYIANSNVPIRYSDVDTSEINFVGTAELAMEVYTIDPVTVHVIAYGGSSSYLFPVVKFEAVTTAGAWEKVILKNIFTASGKSNADIKYVHLSFSFTPSSAFKPVYISRLFVDGKDKDFGKSSDWLVDPLNPHAIASERGNTYTSYTLMSIADCMLAYADSEFTQDTAESVPRARLLYESALQLLNGEGMKSPLDYNLEKINKLDAEVKAIIQEDTEWYSIWELLKTDLFKVKSQADLNALLSDIRLIVNEEENTTEQKLKIVRTEINTALDNPGFFRKVHSDIADDGKISDAAYLTLLSDVALRNRIQNDVNAVSSNYLAAIQTLTKVPLETLLSKKVYAQNTAMAQLGQVKSALSSGVASLEEITGSLDDLDKVFLSDLDYNTQADAGNLNQFLLNDLKRSIALVMDYKIQYHPSSTMNFCVPPNPIVKAFRMKAELNLFKIRNCRNISGIVRELDPFAAPTDATSGVPQFGGSGSLQLPGTIRYQPTIYRYSTLIERAKQLVQIAQQIEASMLSTLEKLDAERYSLLKARQDLDLSRAGIKLQDLRIKEAKSGIRLAELQKERSELQVSELQKMIDEGLNSYEVASIQMLLEVIDLTLMVSALNAASTLANAGAQALSSGNPFARTLYLLGGVIGAFSASMSGQAQAKSINSNIASIMASFERRKQEWEFQKTLANKDVQIGSQQITIAQDHLAVTGQERQIAQIQTDHSQATIDFLQNKFTNAELYDWMSGILEGVYAFFLQQATAIAKQAQGQLAFERQESPSEFIKSDYWSAPSDNLLQSGTDPNKSIDRKGLTGSVRLLQDIFQLDQFAFSTDKRKLELTKTISLATLAPGEFQRFKETGELMFELPMRLFDRDFPGHYLRLIKRVRTSVIALIPPVEGIKATLSNTGVSYVITGGDTFGRVPLARDPESVALTSTVNATGLFELTPVQNEKLLPFENTGVESRWIFSMPKASNFFDYSSIADILFTVEYTALSDNFYKSQVTNELDVVVEAERPFSFRNQFADQWYDLCNPELTATPMKVSFNTSALDFPPNLRNIKIQNLLMYFAVSDALDPLDPVDAETIELIQSLPVTALNYNPKGKATKGGSAFAQGNIISTRKTGGSNWLPIAGEEINGTWELEFSQDLAGLFKNEKITDILFVISYKAEAPEWPK